MPDPAEYLTVPYAIGVIGAGPAGMMAAEVLSNAGQPVDLYESMPSAGRKFLVAGSSGLNLTHSEPEQSFLSRYGEQRDRLEPFLRQFGAQQMREWAAGLDVETFVGTSGRVFPKEMKAAPLLFKWRKRLEANAVRFHYHHRWQGWTENGALRFETPKGQIQAHHSIVILALGGASWPQLGSTGTWQNILAAKGIPLAPFRPANCGFNIGWSQHFRDRYEGQPLKSVILEVETDSNPLIRQGEFIITPEGIEGSLIYALSAPIRDRIESKGSAVVHLDLAPGRSQEELQQRLSQPRGSRTRSSHLEKTTGLKGVKAGLLYEFVPREDMDNPAQLAGWIKHLPLRLLSPRPLEEAISSAGGVKFDALDEQLMLKKLPGVFCAGEMLDWEAPTGGYLITACCSTGRAAGLGALAWLNARSKAAIP